MKNQKTIKKEIKALAVHLNEPKKSWINSVSWLAFVLAVPKRLVHWFGNISLAMKIIVLVVLVILLGVGYWSGTKILTTGDNKITYQTEVASKGTLIKTVSGSGAITSGNSTSVNTKVSGEVKTVYVTNGDKVVKGQKIAEVIPDEYAAERQTAAYVTYTNALEAVKTAQKNKITADLAMWTDRQSILDANDNVNYMNNHKGENPSTHEAYTVNEETVIVKTLEQAKLSYEENELKYKNANSEIAAAAAKVSSTWREYQENSSTVYAPISGVITDLMLAPGMVVNSSSLTSSTTGATIVSSQTVAKISSDKGQLIATVNLSEIDVIGVGANQKVTLTLDAYEDKTFTGKVLAVNTAGSVNSGVTSYPVSILLDDVGVDIYPNMTVNAEIITAVKTDVLMIPTTAITQNDESSSVSVMKDLVATIVNVETGLANDSQTEIISGLSEGDMVVTGTVTKAQKSSGTTSNTSSPFSGLNRTRSSSGSTRSSGGGNAIMMGPPGM